MKYLLFLFTLIFLCAGAGNAAQLTVTKTADTNDGLCNSDCSLREAILLATSGDTIIFASPLFDSPQTITLSDASGFRYLVINKDLTITGKGANLLTIQRLSTEGHFQIFDIESGTVNLTGMTITGGATLRNFYPYFGGAIFNAGNLTVTACNITNNLDENTVSNAGAIYSGGNGTANLTLINSTVSDNNTPGFRGTGGIYHDGNVLTIINSTISGNNCNSSQGCSGGGVYVNKGTATITGSTITNNFIFSTSAGSGISAADSIPVTIRNSIIAANRSPNNNSIPDVAVPAVSSSYNIIGNGSGISNLVNGANGDQVGTAAAPINPKLTPLGYYGGQVPTHSLLTGSPAIDQGKAFSLTTDGRGFARPVDLANVANAAGGDGSDIGAFERQTTNPGGLNFSDFDGDAISELSVFRPTAGTWYFNQANGFAAVTLGSATDKLAPADYDGDGKADVAVYSGGYWTIRRSSDLQISTVGFGAAEDIPVPADFDGDGKADISVYRPSNGVWYRLNSSNGNFVANGWGAAEDKPVAGDFDGDGKADLCVYRPSNGVWYLIKSSNNEFVATGFGAAEDLTVPADYDGDGKTDIAVYRPSNNVWYRLNSSNGAFAAVGWGSGTDKPVPADYDGDGKADVAVYRDGTWYIVRSSDGQISYGYFGAAGDVPLANAYVR